MRGQGPPAPSLPAYGPESYIHSWMCAEKIDCISFIKKKPVADFYDLAFEVIGEVMNEWKYSSEDQSLHTVIIWFINAEKYTISNLAF